MDSDTVEEIGIDSEERLYLRPSTASFPFIYREAMEVHWCEKNNLLNSPKPREWSYFDWYMQIIKAAKEQGYIFKVTDKTRWVNIPEKLKNEILQ